jgi:hypothetical protein
MVSDEDYSPLPKSIDALLEGGKGRDKYGVTRASTSFRAAWAAT